ncbi:MAG: Type II secretion system protein E [Desulfotomaculum sp. 46_296]|nr:MAG: Type II secretion system protein E [Desulfotomaculum sp. 46_296]HAU32101.1 type II secretion system protein E [Desulfotomaculum sp.]
MIGERTARIRTGPLFNLVKEQVAKKNVPEVNPDVARKLAFLEDLKEKTIKKVIDNVAENISFVRSSEEEKTRFKKGITEIVNLVLAEEEKIISRVDRDKIVQDVTNEITGYGPIDPLLDDPEISEIMVNGPKKVYVEKKGRIIETDATFRDDDHVRKIIDKIISPLGRRLDDTSAMVDARLPDGSRVNAVIPPLAVDGPVLTIRKFSKSPLTVDDLIEFGTMSAEVAIFLKACVESRINIMISGGTGSGKTTTLNVISSFIPPDERIVTIEDAAELQLWQDHIVRLETRPPNIEGKGRVTTRDLLINTLRMRPDRIVVGEVRGGEALDMLQAMNTGHDGSITTGHANSPRDILFRLETMVLMAGVELPLRAVREQIAASINLIVHQERFKDGTRKITNVTEITGMEGDTITLQDIFVFKQTGIDERGRVAGRYSPTGIVPRFIRKMESAGIYLPHQIFITF